MATRIQYCFDGFTLDGSTGELERSGKRQRLQELPLTLLLELLARPGEMVSRGQLIACLWPQGIVEFETGLNTAVSKLRTALGDNADQPRYIETVPRKGYRFIGTLNDSSVSSADNISATNNLAKIKTVNPLSLWLGVAAVFLAAIWLGLYLLNPSIQNVRIAVLPFQNLSPDPDNAFFTDGLHEEILSSLTNRGTNLEVISRTTMMTYRDKPKTASLIAQELGATHVLEGSVRREGNTVRLTLQLIDAPKDNHLWSKQYDRDLNNIMLMQTEVAQEVATQLAIKLSPPSDDLPPSNNAEAYDLLLKAKIALPLISQRTDPSEIERVMTWLDQAINLDPNFAAAYVERAQLKIIKYVWNIDLTTTNAEGARNDIAKAYALAGEHPKVIQADTRYAVIDGNYIRVRRISNQPRYLASKDPSTVRWRAFSACRQGLVDEGLALFEQANKLDPNNITNTYAWSRELWNAGRGAEAYQVVQQFNKRGAGQLDSGDLLFAFTGNIEALADDVEKMGEQVDRDTRFAARLDILRYQNRFAEMLGLFSQSLDTQIRPLGFREATAPGIGSKPIAELHGWTLLLLGNNTATEEGRILLEFANTGTVINARNKFIFQILEAEAYLFQGQNHQAIESARAILNEPAAEDNNRRRFAELHLAKVFAWAGAHDEAVNLLENLSTRFPMIGPAEITRDPLYSIPLANNKRFQQLTEKLEAEIVSNQRLFNAI